MVILKKVLAMFVLLMFYCLPVFAADDATVVDSFKQYTSDKMEKVIATYTGDTYRIRSMQSNAYWFKVRREIDPNYKIDVQKTNSLISPYKATLEVTFKSTFYRIKSSKDAAEVSNDIDFNSKEIYYLTLAYQKEKWVVTEAKSYDFRLREWEDIKPEYAFGMMEFIK